jgi:hypothetical protein
MSRPKILEDVGFDIFVDASKLRDLPLPVEEKSINELIWCFNYPVWEKDGTDDWNLSPQEVIDQVEGSDQHRSKVDTVDLLFPLVIVFNKNKWVILDGIHRLVKAYLQGQKSVKVKILTKDSEYFKAAQI